MAQARGGDAKGSSEYKKERVYVIHNVDGREETVLPGLFSHESREGVGRPNWSRNVRTSKDRLGKTRGRISR